MTRCSWSAARSATALRTEPGHLLALGLRHERGLSGDPVDVFGLIRDLGVRLVLVNRPSDLQGMYIRRDGQHFILVNSADHPRRQRLTAAHELGHRFLVPEEEAEVEIVDTAADDRAEEVQAYNFARELLLPRQAVHEECKGRSLEDAVAHLAEHYDVSPEVAAIRLQELGLVSWEAKETFREKLKDPEQRARFGSPGRRRRPQAVELDPRYLDLAKRLYRNGVLSEERYRELTEPSAP